MLAVVSPAKSLDFTSELPTKKHSDAQFLDRSAELIEVLRPMSPPQLAKLMSISYELAELNVERFADWDPPFTPDTARPALLAFAGDTYIGMDAAASFGERDYTRAQRSLRILSGLYGVLRPLDLIQPYRLEMGTRLPTSRGETLYDFWGSTITEALAGAVADSPGTPALVNLASVEYFSAVDPDAIDATVVTPRFLDRTARGEMRTVAFHAKRARGAMAGWMIQERIGSIRALRDFDRLGYRYCPESSSPTEPVFARSDVV